MSYCHLSTESRQARKSRRCIWCGESIPAASQYVHEAGVYDGDFQWNHFHPECHEAKDRFFLENDGDDSFSPWEFVRGSDQPR